MSAYYPVAVLKLIIQGFYLFLWCKRLDLVILYQRYESHISEVRSTVEVGTRI